MENISIQEYFRETIQGIKEQARYARSLLMSIRSGNAPFHTSHKDVFSADVVFISHLLNPDQAGMSDDFYYGSFPCQMSARGFRVAVVLINHTAEDSCLLAKRWEGSSVPRLVLSKILGLRDEQSIRAELRGASKLLGRRAKLTRPGLFKRVLTQASKEALSAQSQTTLRIKLELEALFGMFKPKLIIATYEGHAWERMAFTVATEQCPGSRRFGYVHAALFRLQHAVRRNLLPQYNPDLILTAGNVTKSILQNAPSLGHVQVATIGSNKYINSEEISSKDKPKSHRNKVCLVIPEGMESECYLMFMYSINCAIAYPDIRFIWRLHPLISFNSLKRRNRLFRSLPSNVTLSHRPLIDDAFESGWVLYRGSTAVFTAVLANCIPVYLNVKDQLSIDPLYEVTKGENSVLTTYELIEYMSKGCNEAPETNLIEYCSNYFTAPSIAELVRAVVQEDTDNRSISSNLGTLA